MSDQHALRVPPPLPPGMTPEGFMNPEWDAWWNGLWNVLEQNIREHMADWLRDGHNPLEIASIRREWLHDFVDGIVDDATALHLWEQEMGP